ncbi:MAG TPA: phage tail protein [Lachnoclostridium sp.]|uniref:phage tail tube protein n=1 Tax=Lacrimispora sp. TaxID=2719234 RepID=UPI000EC1B72F|nr:phage tail tube protein [Lacrimispora sp.]HCD46259.1 phage tail protein [Lachnoclostridium sp.]
MLANGITLAMKKEAESTFTKLLGLKEVPELGVDPEKVDNTTLEDKMKHSELGIGDPGDLAYKFKWENDVDSSYRKLRAVSDTKETVSFEQTFPDGTKFHFDAQCSVKVSGGGVNAAIEYTLNLGLQTDIVVVDPTA